ncbi:DNA-binding response regulator [Streptacidiphilus sp. EB103A]|uniref:response regulator transcription factor n=1 Tax=Streptacidiphilus sp. EB103A TaxID=3156275 RepID=UPI003513D1FF
MREWRLDGLQVVVWSIDPGSDVSRQVSKLASAHMRVLLLSSRWTAAELRSALVAGAAGLLIKDANPERLVVAVGAAVAGYTLVNAELDFLASRPAGHGGRSRAGHHSVGSGTDSGKPDPAQGLLNLSDREFEVLSLLADGRSTLEVAQILAITAATVKSHVSHVLGKLKVRNRVEAVLMYQQAIAQHTSVIAMDTQDQSSGSGGKSPTPQYAFRSNSPGL